MQNYNYPKRAAIASDARAQCLITAIRMPWTSADDRVYPGSRDDDSCNIRNKINVMQYLHLFLKNKFLCWFSFKHQLTSLKTKRTQWVRPMLESLRYISGHNLLCSLEFYNTKLMCYLRTCAVCYDFFDTYQTDHKERSLTPGSLNKN